MRRKRTIKGVVSASRNDGKESESGDDDMVTRIFERFFGKREESVLTFGLKRVNAETNPELWPADVDVENYLTPIEGIDDKVYTRRTILESKLQDDYEVAYDSDAWYLRQMLKGTSLEERELMTLFDSSEIEDGFSAVRFHEAVDGYGPALVLCETPEGSIFGGYNPCGWVGYGDQRDAISAFLFTFPNGMTSRPIKLQKVGGPSLAIEDDPNAGPKFGVGSLECAFGIDEPQRVKSRLGSYYARLPNKSNTLFTRGESSKSARVSRVRVFGATDCGLREVDQGEESSFYR